MEFSRQEYQSALPFPTPGNLPNPEIKPTYLSLLHWQVESLLLNNLGSPGSYSPPPPESPLPALSAMSTFEYFVVVHHSILFPSIKIY